MRRTLLLLSVAVALAGCFGGGDESDAPPTTTTPEATTTPEVSTTTPTTATPEPTPATPTPDAEPEPTVIANQTFDFSSEGDVTGQSPKSRESEPVPEGYGNVTVNITLTRTSTGPTTLPVSGSLNAPTVRVLDATGAEVAVASEEGETVSVTAPAVPGKYTIRYEGAGTMRANVLLVASP